MSDFVNAFAPVEAAQAARVRQATFGHLSPSVRKKYHGSIVFTHTECGQMIPICSDFPKLPGSPVFDDHLCDFVAEKAVEAGKVYKFVGTYMLFKNGNPSFSGTITEVVC